ncbi:hypothetical protein [Mycobacterium sp. TY814]|uniref:hypothetical protein n=1 Tax=unclassified Mycobacterium TaxID=2642494 RepID=UPI0027421725|nr:hypothetical protein [Mycobacterium sp. TY814]MDP7726385.1 hypothetical protein [Mycobacterium sp. TY814]
MVTNICPACGYPTLHPTLCAFCCPSDSPSTGNHGIGRMSFTRNFEPSWITRRDSDSYSPARVSAWPGPIAS